ncbi:MAG: sulfatase-like hydrolase/transferase [Bryobacterales bacterium]|nr:sulfatase-like hydrolase/transferase [Bryobacterales bacterium]
MKPKLNRRAFLAAGTAAGVWAQGRRPNIIIICTDDHGSGDLGCYGSAEIKTPHLDSIARDGVRFDQWYANAAMCAPSRAGVLTGRHPIRAGVPSNGPQLPSNQKTLAALLKPNGYRTAAIGKWHLGTAQSNGPLDHGFDTFYGFHAGCVDFYSHRYYWGEPRVPNFHDLYRDRREIFEDGAYLTERITAEARQFIRDSGKRPFFLYLAYNAPHYPMHAPPKYVERFQHLPLERRIYAAMIAAVDDGVGEIRAQLWEMGLTNDTVLVFIGDNGATTEPRAGLEGRPATAGHNRGFRGFKFSLFDGGTHVPALMAWPGRIPAGRVTSQIGAHYDLAPTLLAAAGVPEPQAGFFDGVNLLPSVMKGDVVNRPALHWHNAPQLAIRKGQWKLTLNGYEASGTPESRKPITGEDAVFLANLEQDPGEKKNLRREFPAVAEELEKELRAWLDAVQKSAPKTD